MNIIEFNRGKLVITFIFFALLSVLNVNLLLRDLLPVYFGIFNLVITLFLPGYLLTKMFKVQGHIGEVLGYSAVLSISFLIFLGLGINNGLPLIGINKPLSLLPFLVSFDLLSILFFIIVLAKEKLHTLNLKLPQVNTLSFVFIIYSFLLLEFSLLGTIWINNFNSNIFTLCTLLGISFYLILVIIFRKHLQNYVYSISIFCISLALLLIYSLRVPYLMGWDIQGEYKVFQLTKQNHLWSILSYHNAYNATLGITILPTLLSNLINIPDIFIFKLIYPVLFSFSGTGVYYLLKRFFNPAVSYIAAFFFIVQMSFASMPSLARQEIAYLALIYLFLCLFDDRMKSKFRVLLFLLLGFTMVVSHYSTSYIAIILFLLTYAVSRSLKIIIKLFPKTRISIAGFYLNVISLVVLAVFTVFWYGFYTNSVDNIQNMLVSIQRNISKIHTQEGQSMQSWITIFGNEKATTGSDLQKYIEQFSNRDSNQKSEYYTDETINKYPVFLTRGKEVIGIPSLRLNADYLVLAIRQIIKLLMLGGLLHLVLLFFIRKKTVVPVEWLILSGLYITLIISAIVIPSLSNHYNMERLYQQGLIILAALPVLVISIIPKIRITIRYLLISFIFIIYFFSYHGVFAQFLGGEPGINLNNYGAEFDQYYFHNSEIRSAKWMDDNRNTTSYIYGDRYSELRFSGNTKIIYTANDLIPLAIRKNSYVYANQGNINSNIVYARTNNGLLYYNFPFNFLNENKNLIYSNNKSSIYK